MEDMFECKSIYIGIHSSLGCTLSVSCAFPNQVIQDKDESQLLNITNKEITSKFKNEIDDQIEKMGNDLGAQKLWAEHLHQIRVNRERAGL